MFNFNKYKKTFREYKKSLEPREEFVRDTKRVFLAVFKEKFPQKAPSHSYTFTYLVRGLATSVAVVALAVTTSTYADYKNVGAENMLYPLKRMSESARLAFSSVENKPTLHLEFAERRMGELAELKNENMENGRIAKLANEAREEVKKSFAITVAGESDVVKTATTKPGGVLEKSDGSPPDIFTQKGSEETHGETATPAQENINLPKELPSPPSQLKSGEIKEATTQSQEQTETQKQAKEMGATEEIIVAEPQKTRILPATRFARPCETLQRIFESEFSEVQKATQEDIELKTIFERECLLILR